VRSASAFEGPRASVEGNAELSHAAAATPNIKIEPLTMNLFIAVPPV
jgi:hypothetical protein